MTVDPRESERILDRRLWAAVMLSRHLEVVRSIVAGQKVMAGRLDAQALKRALRGGTLPPPDKWIRVTVGMLDALAESGPIGETS